MKRPFVWGFGIVFAAFILMDCFFGDLIEKKQYLLEDIIEQEPDNSCKAEIYGTLDSIETKPNSIFLYLKNSSVTLPANGNTYSLAHLLVITEKNSQLGLLPGNILTVSGKLQNFGIPTNPGQFDEKTYYREKNIYYKVFASTLRIQNAKTDWLKALLFRIQQKIFDVYRQCLPSKDAGVVSAMLLGEKSALDKDIREQYQKNGIGHILASYFYFLYDSFSGLVKAVPAKIHFLFDSLFSFDFIRRNDRFWNIGYQSRSYDAASAI